MALRRDVFGVLLLYISGFCALGYIANQFPLRLSRRLITMCMQSKEIEVSLTKPMGIELEEVDFDQGLYIASLIKGGNAAKSGFLDKGLKLTKVNGVDVRNKDYEDIMKTIKASPATLTMSFIQRSNLSPNKMPTNLIQRGPKDADRSFLFVKNINYT